MLSEVFTDPRTLAQVIVVEVLYERGLAGGAVGRAALAELEVRSPVVALNVELARRRRRDAAIARMGVWARGMLGAPMPGSIFDVTVA